jgi:hypothetical protein
MKIYLCTTATSKDIKSWSNIPYLLHKNLEKKGFVVINYVLREILPIKFFFNLPVRVLNKFFGLNSLYFYVRTPLHFYSTWCLSQFIGFISKSEDVMVVQGFSYPLKNSKNKMIIVGDWPSSYLFEKFLKRAPSRFEKNSIDREDRVIEKANAVITLFPDVHKFMLQKYKNKNIYYFGNVINIDDDVKIPIDILQKKERSQKLLFVGKPFYIGGAIELIKTVEILRSTGHMLEVDIVGIEAHLIDQKFNWLRFHGYLDKSNPIEKKKYYELLENAKLFVNTTHGWNAFQATLEAMYFYNPIVVRANANLLLTFPNLEKLGYILNNEEIKLEEVLLSCLKSHDEYLAKCKESHLAVGPYTWDRFTQNLIGLVNE